MKKNVIVSLADANYYPWLDELIDSIKQFKESENVAICILDAGLTNEQKEILLMFYISFNNSTILIVAFFLWLISDFSSNVISARVLPFTSNIGS